MQMIGPPGRDGVNHSLALTRPIARPAIPTAFAFRNTVDEKKEAPTMGRSSHDFEPPLQSGGRRSYPRHLIAHPSPDRTE